MKRLFKHVGASALLASIGIALAAHAVDESSLLVIGPVDIILPKEHAAVILGQKVFLKSPELLTIGETAVVFGKLGPNGAVVASDVRHQGPYVAGATKVLLTGIVHKSDASVGHAQVGGITVDLTPAMAFGPVSATVGDIVQVVGIQPSSNGLILANGISGSGKTINGISGSGKTVNGISGSGLTVNGISGSGKTVNGISGSGKTVNGISGSGLTVNGISGSGLTVNGISGSGKTVNGISGSGKTVNGISGSGKSINGISGSGKTVNGISGSG